MLDYKSTFLWLVHLIGMLKKLIDLECVSWEKWCDGSKGPRIMILLNFLIGIVLTLLMWGLRNYFEAYFYSKISFYFSVKVSNFKI